MAQVGGVARRQAGLVIKQPLAPSKAHNLFVSTYLTKPNAGPRAATLAHQETAEAFVILSRHHMRVGLFEQISGHAE